jgi:hypothetical protein
MQSTKRKATSTRDRILKAIAPSGFVPSRGETLVPGAGYIRLVGPQGEDATLVVAADVVRLTAVAVDDATWSRQRRHDEPHKSSRGRATWQVVEARVLVESYAAEHAVRGAV